MFAAMPITFKFVQNNISSVSNCRRITVVYLGVYDYDVMVVRSSRPLLIILPGVTRQELGSPRNSTVAVVNLNTGGNRSG